MSTQRRRTQETSEDNKSLKKVILFCLIVGSLIIISLLIRFLIVVKNSKFDGTNRFTIAVVQKKTYEIISVDPASSTISTMSVRGKVTSEPPQRAIGVPLDGSVIVISPYEIPKDPSGALFSIIFHPTMTKSDITGVDLVRLYLYAKTVSSKNIHEDEITLPSAENDVNKLVTQLFADGKIIDDNMTVEIVNGTDVPGMAKRLERIIDNAGGNVVAVSSTHTVEKVSKIYYYQKPSYTQAKLQRLLGYPAIVTQTQGIADIKIIIGEDEKNTRKF